MFLGFFDPFLGGVLGGLQKKVKKTWVGSGFLSGFCAFGGVSGALFFESNHCVFRTVFFSLCILLLFLVYFASE